MITHTNRMGQRYFLKTAVTKSGKPSWYASLKAEKGTNAKAMPEGYAFYEDIHGQVFVRKPIKTQILPEEIDAAERACGKIQTDCKVVVGKKDLVVYISDFKPSFLDWMSAEFRSYDRRHAEEHMRNTARFSPAFRFVLENAHPRRFSVERMCYRGPEEHWHPLRAGSDIIAALEEFIPFLDDMDEFFELI